MKTTTWTRPRAWGCSWKFGLSVFGFLEAFCSNFCCFCWSMQHQKKVYNPRIERNTFFYCSAPPWGNVFVWQFHGLVHWFCGASTTCLPLSWFLAHSSRNLPSSASLHAGGEGRQWEKKGALYQRWEVLRGKLIGPSSGSWNHTVRWALGKVEKLQGPAAIHANEANQQTSGRCMGCRMTSVFGVALWHSR